MKYAKIVLALFLLVLMSGTLPLKKMTETIFITETKEVPTPNAALYTLPQSSPLPDFTINSTYGMRKHPVHKIWKLHTGCDLACPIGTKLYAQGNGKVIKTEVKWSGYGINLTILHGLDENGHQITMRYAHLDQILVKEGDFVKQGDLIALTGNTGTSTGPHLHVEYRINSKPVNPENHLNFDNTRDYSISSKTDTTKSLYEREYMRLHESQDSSLQSDSSRLWVVHSKKVAN